MKLWREPQVSAQKLPRKTVAGEKDEIIRRNSFYLSDKGRSRDDYLYSPENRQIASFPFHKN